MPDKKQSFQNISNIRCFTYRTIFYSNSFHIYIDSMINFLLVLRKGLRFPVITHQLSVLRPLLEEGLLGIIDEHIFK